MATHRIYGTAAVAGAPVVRSLDIVSAADWNALGLAAAVVATVTSDGSTGEWSAELDSAELVYVFPAPVPPYPPQMLGPYKPEPL